MHRAALVLDVLHELVAEVLDHGALGDAAAMPVRAMIKHFRAEFVQHIEGGGCPLHAAASAGAPAQAPIPAFPQVGKGRAEAQRA